MVIKGREFKEISIKELPFREDFISLCLEGTKKDPTLTIVCWNCTNHKMPRSMMIDGNESVISEMDKTYQNIILDIYGDTDEEYYEEFFWMGQSHAPFLKSKKAKICFYNGSVYSEV